MKTSQSRMLCFEKDRTLGGPAVVGSLLVLLLILISVVRHPSSLGTGLLITDITLLSGYGVFSVWVWRQRDPKRKDALAAGAGSAILLGVVLIASHAIEWFALDVNRTAQLARGAGSVLLMLALLGAAGSAGWERTRSIKLAVVAGLWCGTLAILMLLNFAFTLNLAFERHAASWLHGAFEASGMSDPGAFVVRNSLEAASEVLVRVPAAALVLSFLGSLSNAWIRARSRSFAVFAAWVASFILLAGAGSLWYADSLQRAARPPFVMAGILAAGIALCGAHPIWSFLSRSRPGARYP